MSDNVILNIAVVSVQSNSTPFRKMWAYASHVCNGDSTLCRFTVYFNFCESLKF